MKKQKSKQKSKVAEPVTNQEYLDALAGIDCSIEEEEGGWTAFCGNSTTRLDSEDYASALMEAWALYKP